MKKIVLLSTVLISIFNHQVFSQANISLSNLSSPTSINTSLLPANDNQSDLGSVAKSWRDCYLAGSLYIGDHKFLTSPNSSSTFAGNTGNTNNSGTDNSAFGFQAMQNNSTGYNNSAFGSTSLQNNTTGVQLSAFGSYSLASNTDGSNNTAVGTLSLYSNSSGYSNSAVGTQALELNSTGFYNTAIGAFSINNNTSGYQNTGAGFNTLFNNSTGYNNTALGNNSLFSNTLGSYNTATGSFSLFSNTSGTSNCAYGVVALYTNSTGTDNSAFGSSALFANTTGSSNNAFGSGALSSSTTANGNSAFGTGSLQSNTTGYENSAFGGGTLTYNLTGYHNTAVGNLALSDNNDGIANSALGYFSLYFNDGDFNVSLGAYSLESNTTGSYNTACGTDALNANTTSSYNVAVGDLAGSSFVPGGKCTFVGANAYPNANGYKNSSSLGYNARTTASNQVRIGSSAVTSIGGYVNWSNISDGRFKKNVEENVVGLEFISKLRPVTYTLDVNGIEHFLNKETGTINDKTAPEQNSNDQTEIANKESLRYSGFIAQEVEDAAKKAGYNFSGIDAPKNTTDLYGLRYADFVVPLVKSVQELEAIINKKDEELKNLQNKLSHLQNILLQKGYLSPEEIKSENISTNQISLTGAILEQNIPNPFSSETIIKYYLPASPGTAKIIIANSEGVIMKSIEIDHKGPGQVQIKPFGLPTGNYVYSLVVDDRIIDSKQMVLSK